LLAATATKIVGANAMLSEPFRIESPDRYDIATEVLSSAVRVLQAAGFSEAEIPKLFEQVANRPVRAPLWIEPSEPGSVV
jgi:hypothetical protein